MNQRNWFDKFDQDRLCQPQAAPDFDGDTYDPTADHERLSTALGRVWDLMRDGEVRTLAEIARSCETSEAGASARLRDLRKEKFRRIFPSVDVCSKRQQGGLWVYWIVVEERWRRR